MTMHRRPLGQGRTLAAVAGVVIILGSFLPWWQVGGGDGLPLVSGNAFDGSGILVFLVGVATLALVALPYAVGWIGFGWRVIDLFMSGAFTFTEPLQVFTHGPGLWLCGLGLALLSRAVYQMTREPVYR